MTTHVELSGIPETMLWTLHNRASEARRPNGFLHDPDCVRIYDAIQYDYVRNFGHPDDSHPMRSKIFDDVLRPWLVAHPGGTVVELAAGLETQFQRCDDGQVRWLCVDVPEAIAIRERFLSQTDRCRYLSMSALDLRWMDEVDGSAPVFISAQGLFMYFEPHQVESLLQTIMNRFRHVALMFDVIPRWLSRKTCTTGFSKTPHYRAPRMPWGVDRDEIELLLRRWSPRVDGLRIIPFGYARGVRHLMVRVFSSLPKLRNVVPTIVHVTTATK